jgi:hypothetical protein
MTDRHEAGWEFIETAWRIRVPSGQVLECGIYSSQMSFEARIGYEEKRLVSQSSYDLATVREAAESFRVRTLAKDGYAEVPLHLASIEPFPGGRIVRHGDRMTVHAAGPQSRDAARVANGGSRPLEPGSSAVTGPSPTVTGLICIQTRQPVALMERQTANGPTLYCPGCEPRIG